MMILQEVSANSPASKSGLIGDQDYIVATDAILSERDDLYDLVLHWVVIILVIVIVVIIVILIIVRVLKERITHIVDLLITNRTL